MDKKDLEYSFKERKTDFNRLAMIYLKIKEDAEKSFSLKDKKIETSLNIRKLKEKVNLTPNVIRKKLEELKELGIIDYCTISNQLRIYFNPKNENCSYLDNLINKAKNEKLL